MSIALTLDRLPNDVLVTIISFVRFKDLSCLRRVSKRFNDLCEKQLKTRQLLCVTTSECYKNMRIVANSTLFADIFTVHLSYEKLLFMTKRHLNGNIIRTVCMENVEGVNEYNIALLGDFFPNLESFCFSQFWVAPDFKRVNRQVEFSIAQLFGKCRKLTKFVLHNSEINGNCFTNVPKLRSLWATFVYFPLDCSGLQRLSESLEKLYLSQNRVVINIDILKYFSKLKALGVVANTREMTSIFYCIASNNSVVDLYIHWLEPVGDKVSCFANCVSVRQLYLKVPKMSDDYLTTVVKTFPYITKLYLEISGCWVKGLDKYRNAFLSISECQTLQQINICLRNTRKAFMDTYLNEYCHSIFECEHVNLVKLGFLLEYETKELLLYLNDICRQKPQRNIEIYLFTRGKPIDSIDPRIHVFNEEHKEFKFFDCSFDAQFWFW